MDSAGGRRQRPLPRQFALALPARECDAIQRLALAIIGLM
jgi:hypothetical protein